MNQESHLLGRSCHLPDESDGGGYTVVRSYATDKADGLGAAELLEASEGVLYGATPAGRTNKLGTLQNEQ